jgi:16S rRNA (uracil1498-N3)-methyltransferase
MHVFYIPGIISDVITFSEPESRHCIKVLRLGMDDEVCIVDGAGGFYRARLSSTNSKCCSAVVFEKISAFGKRNFHLHIAIAPTKSITRFEWFLEKAAEIGIDEITPLRCEHSEKKVLNTNRVMKIIISAMKQSVKAYQPKINPMTDLKKFLLQDITGRKFIAHCSNAETAHLKSLYHPGENVLILVGPEGGFSDSEVLMAAQNGFVPVSLGNSRLRTETAGIVACHVINMLNES